MKYNVRKWNPLLIGIPDIGVGMYWGLIGTIIPWYAYKFTNSAEKVSLILTMAALIGLIMQLTSGTISDHISSRWGKRTPLIVLGAVAAAITQVCWYFAPNYTVLLILVCATFFFVNVYQAPYYTIVMEVMDKDQIGLANSIARTTSNVGGFIISFIAAFIWARGEFITGIVYGFSAAKIVDKINKLKFLRVMMVLFILVLFSGCFIRTSVTALYIFMGFEGTVMLALFITVYSMLPDVAPKGRLGEYIGLINIFIAGPQLVIVSTTGLLLDSSYGYLLYPIATAVLIVGFFVSMINCDKKRMKK